MTRKMMDKIFRNAVAVALLAGAPLSTAAPARAHGLGGGGSPMPSGSSGNSSAKAWNELDPAPGEEKTDTSSKSDQEREAMAAKLKAIRAGCDSLEPSRREACYGQVSAAGAAVGDAWKKLDSQPGKEPAAAEKQAGPPSKLDQEREAEAARIKSMRADCAALDASESEACYGKMKIDHEKWHEKHEPMRNSTQNFPALTGFKKLPEARAKCLKMTDAKKRDRCLKALLKKKVQAPAPAVPDAKPAADR